MNQQKTQTPEERVMILRDYFINDFPRCFPHLEQILDANGKITCKPSYVLMFDAIRGLEFVRKDLVNEILLDLDSKELLVRKNVIERIVEVERQPTAAEIAKAKKDKFEREHSQGFHQDKQRTELDRDDKFKKPPLLEEEKVAINARNSRINEVLGETLSSVNNYSAGRNHARTSDRRVELTTLFNQHRNKVNDVESAEKLQRTIADKINSYDRSSSGVR